MTTRAPKILYIEDNPQNRLLVRSVLVPAGYTVVSADDGLTGIEVALREQPALILLDINLPGVDGYEVVAILRSFQHLAEVPIIAVTAYAMAGDRERTLAAGCDGYIEKPIDVDLLPDQVAQFLNGKRERVKESEEGAYLRELNQRFVYRLLHRVEDLNRLNEHFVRRAGQLERLHAAMQDITSELDVRALLEQLLPALVEALGSRRLTVELTEAEGAITVSAEGTDTMPTTTARVIPGLNDAAADEWTEVEWRVPLTVRGRELGTIIASHVLPPGAAADEEQLLKIIARQVATAIENSRLYENARHTVASLEESQRRVVQSERLRALGEMAGGVAHDFNNMLAIIIARAELIASSTPDLEMQRQLDVIIKVALDATQTVKRIQEFSRVRRSCDVHAVDLNRLIGELLEMTRSRWKDAAEARGVRYDINVLAGALSPVAGEPGELREALTNILFNALDAMPGGGSVVFETEMVDGRVQCSITDSGVGMPAEVRERVFDPFFTTKGERGTGLGLSVAYGIVARHGGDVDVESRVGVGTTFTIRLPIATERAAGADSPAPPPAPRDASVLVVDDESEVRETIRDLLARDGHRVTMCANGDEALEALDRGEFDLVITDLGMPGMSGWDVARHVKSRTPDMPVAMITGWGDGIDQVVAVAHGVDHVIPKPFRRTDLQRVMHTVLAGGPVITAPVSASS